MTISTDLYTRKNEALAEFKNKQYLVAHNIFEEIRNADQTLFEKTCIFQYMWTLYYLKIKLEDTEIEKKYQEYQEHVKFIVSHQKNTDMIYQLVVFRTIDYLGSRSNPDVKKINAWMDMLNPDVLSTEARTIQTAEGKSIEIQSPQEKWYALKSQALLNLKEYETCSKICNEALEKFKQFHFNNDIWFKRRMAIVELKTGELEKALTIYHEILKYKSDWFILKETGDVYMAMLQVDQALKYYVDAALSFGDFEKKIRLFWSLGEIFEGKGMLKESLDHKSVVVLIRYENGWKLLPDEKKFAEENNIKEANDRQLSQLIRPLKECWESVKWKDKKSMSGEVYELMANGKAGFISSGKKSYYFRMMDVAGPRGQIQKGTSVTFFTEKGFDRKKNKETENAVHILKKGGRV